MTKRARGPAGGVVKMARPRRACVIALPDPTGFAAAHTPLSFQVLMRMPWTKFGGRCAGTHSSLLEIKQRGPDSYWVPARIELPGVSNESPDAAFAVPAAAWRVCS